MSVRTTRSFRLGGLLAAGLVLAVGLTACADNTDDEGGAGAGATSSATVSGVTKDDALAAKVPEDIASKGVLVVGTDPTYAPNEYKDGGKIVGFDIDLFDAVAKKLGLSATYTESTFDNIIPGVQGGKYQVGVSSFTDNTEREQVVDFVTYLSAGTQWAQATGGSVDPDNACGITVAVQTGTVQDTDDLPARSKACTDAGKPAIDVKRFDDQGLATTAVVQGQAKAMLADSPITAYAVKQSAGALELDGDVYDAAPYGYAIAKTSGTLKDAIQGAVQSLIDDGTYKQILDKWGNAAGAVTTSEINAAG